MATLQPQFATLNAAADALVNGGILVPEFQKEITDIVKRSGPLFNRMEKVPATGAISRYFEQTAIGQGAFSGTGSQAASPIGSGTIAPTPTSPTRAEKSLLIKAITNELIYSLFDLETVAQQGIFAQLRAKDMSDMVTGITLTNDKGLWTGRDTVSGSQTGTNSGTYGLEYVGLLSQITNSTTIGSSASIVDSIRTAVANLMASTSYNNKPTAIYMNPLAIDYLETEAKNATNSMKYIATDITDARVGLTVNGITTVAGVLPLIPDPFMTIDTNISGVSAAGAGLHNYPFAIVNESLLEYHYVGSQQPRVFELGTVADLNSRYVGIMFGAPVAKGGSYAHTVGAIQRA